jgi:hypothetical protein
MSRSRSFRVACFAVLGALAVVYAGGEAVPEAQAAKVKPPAITAVNVLTVCNGCADPAKYYVFEEIEVANLPAAWGDTEYTLDHYYNSGCAQDTPQRVADSTTFENPFNQPTGTMQYYLYACVRASSPQDAINKATPGLKKVVTDDLALISKNL